MLLTSRSWVQAAAIFDNFAHLARQLDKKGNFEITMINHVFFSWGEQYCGL